MWMKWLPWRWIISSAARKNQFLDPIDIFSRLEQFSQPSEVAAPIQLLRSGVVLHARGLINSQAIQHNLDWVWPFWVERQFNPKSKSFVPRAFSLTHINLTHRNWTAVGLPDSESFPIVDPRGLVTPFFDGWSIDCLIVDKSSLSLIPSRLPSVLQILNINSGIMIETSMGSTKVGGMDLKPSLLSKVQVTGNSLHPVCQITVEGIAQKESWLVILLRPYNPEGISFVHDISLSGKRNEWMVNKKNPVYFDTPWDSHAFSCYRQGDVISKLLGDDYQKKVFCKVGLATAAAQFHMFPQKKRIITLEIPLFKTPSKESMTQNYSRGESQEVSAQERWARCLVNVCELKIPDKNFQFLYDAAIHTLILHSPKEVYPGPYTYKRFWFRDAAFILYAMLSVGFKGRVKRAIDCFPQRQTKNGYFLSQNGEWDSNGEALWIVQKFCQMTQEILSKKWVRIIDSGGQWIVRKRLKEKTLLAHAGLFPPGFSAEHLGPNDYYYWDDFWGVAGLRAAGFLMEQWKDKKRSQYFFDEANCFMESIESSLERVEESLNYSCIPASPYRRLDAGAIGSVAGDYPLKLLSEGDDRMHNTIEFLIKNCLVDNGFFQDMTHSGINPYLTLHIAQVLLRKGDCRYLDLMKAVAQLASSTGQWPEAVHPLTKGGCMGDGQHVWAAAEWVIMIRNCFLFEEENENKLILCAGISDDWLKEGKNIFFGPALTVYGSLSIKVVREESKIIISWDAQWFDRAPKIEIRFPGKKVIYVENGLSRVVLDNRKMSAE